MYIWFLENMIIRDFRMTIHFNYNVSFRSVLPSQINIKFAIKSQKATILFLFNKRKEGFVSNLVQLKCIIFFLLDYSFQRLFQAQDSRNKRQYILSPSSMLRRQEKKLKQKKICWDKNSPWEQDGSTIIWGDRKKK